MATESNDSVRKLLITEVGDVKKNKNGEDYCLIKANDTSLNELVIYAWDTSLLKDIEVGCVINANIEYRKTASGKESLKLISRTILRTAEEQKAYAERKKAKGGEKAEGEAENAEFEKQKAVLDDSETEQKTEGDKSLFVGDKEKLVFPLIPASEIQVRAQSCDEDWVQVLLYKDTRYDMRVLDEMFGIGGWKRDSEILADGSCHMYLSVKIDGEWVTKDEYGSPSDVEPVKSASSDALKRCVTAFGGGRELYSAPKAMYIYCKNKNGEELCRVKQNKKGKYELKDTIVVSYIKYSPDRKIEALKLYNLNLRKECYVWNRKKFNSVTE